MSYSVINRLFLAIIEVIVSIMESTVLIMRSVLLTLLLQRHLMGYHTVTLPTHALVLFMEGMKKTMFVSVFTCRARLP